MVRCQAAACDQGLYIPMKRGYTVGITAHVGEDGDLGLFTNGLRQNVLFLAKLFDSAPDCAGVYLISQSGHKPKLPDWLPWRPKFMSPKRAAVEVDYLLGVGSLVERPLAQAVKARGGVVIRYCGGNDAVLSAEGVVSQAAGYPVFNDTDLFDAVWITPQHWRTMKAWASTLYRCGVFQVPQVWSPMLLKAAAPGFGYKPGRQKWRVACLDPNNTVMKTSHYPMLVCERAWRKLGPAAFEAFRITNTIHLKEYEPFRSFANALSAVKDGAMTFEARWPTQALLSNDADAVVTHQWENELNYLYYDVLWGGYPLIHNSWALRAHGYYYDAFDDEAGAKALCLAWKDYDVSGLPASDDRLFESLDPSNRKLIAAHEALLKASSQ
jgi:Protein of unknown function (DUF2827)